MRPASDGGRQLPLRALAAAVQDDVCAGPRGHRRLRLRAVGLLDWQRARPGQRPRPRPWPPGPRPRPPPRIPRPALPGVGALTQPAPCALRPGLRLAAALLQEADAVAPIGVLADALSRSLVDALCVADGRPGPGGTGP